MGTIKNIEQFYAPSIKGEKKIDFVKRYKDIYENAEEIYDALVKKNKSKKD